jgi:hypothetical protein
LDFLTASPLWWEQCFRHIHFGVERQLIQRSFELRKPDSPQVSFIRSVMKQRKLDS